MLDLYSPEPYYSRGGLVLPLAHSSLPMIPRRPRPFHDEKLRERTIFGELPYGSAPQTPTRTPGKLFDRGYEVAATWINTRTTEQLFAAVDRDLLGGPMRDRQDEGVVAPCAHRANSTSAASALYLDLISARHRGSDQAHWTKSAVCATVGMTVGGCGDGTIRR